MLTEYRSKFHTRLQGAPTASTLDLNSGPSLGDRIDAEIEAAVADRAMP